MAGEMKASVNPGRKRGGAMPETASEEAKEEEKEAESKRKRGGAIHGAKPAGRPDRRARGGATSDADPLTSAGKMSSMPYERVGSKPDGGGKGLDKA